MKSSMIDVDKSVLKQLRADTNLTQKQLGAKLLISEKTVSAWENGRQKIDSEDFRKLCALSGADPLQYIPEAEDKPDNVFVLERNMAQMQKEIDMLREELKNISEQRKPSESYLRIRKQVTDVISMLPEALKTSCPDIDILCLWRYRMLMNDDFATFSEFYHESGKEWGEAKHIEEEGGRLIRQKETDMELWNLFLFYIFDERVDNSDFGYKKWCAKKLAELMLTDMAKIKPSYIPKYQSYEISKMHLDRLIFLIEMLTESKRKTLQDKCENGKYEIGQFETEGNDRHQQVWVHMSAPRHSINTAFSYHASNGYDNPEKDLKMPNLTFIKSLFTGWEEVCVEAPRPFDCNKEDNTEAPTLIQKVAIKLFEKLAPEENEEMQKTDRIRRRYKIYVSGISDEGIRFLEWYKALNNVKERENV